MDLATFIDDPQRRDRLAIDLRTSPAYLWQLATRWRGRQPSPKLAQKIEQATNGQVTRSDLRPDIWPPEDRKHAA